jgi:hypothetical protein
MHVNQKAVIKGAGFFEGTVEGVQHKTGQIFIEEPFDASKPNYKGFRTVEYKCVGADTVKPVMHLEFPITAEVTMEMSATKRGMQVLVTSIKPLSVETKPQPRA